MSEAIKQYEACCVYEDAVLKGHLAFNPSGNLVSLPPGTIRPAVSLEKGEYIEGLKPGWKLGTAADYERLAAEEKARQDAEARASAPPAPKAKK